MIPAAAVLFLAMILLQGILWAAGQRHRRTQLEIDYWAVKAARPELFDWAKECEEFGCHEEDTP